MVSAYTKGRFGNSTWIQMAAWVYAQKHSLSYSAPPATTAPEVWPSYHLHLISSNWRESPTKIGVNDWGHTYRELPFEEEWRENNIMIGDSGVETGYFQSYLYLSGYEDRLRNAFKMNGPIDYGWVAIHWRLGDYRGLQDKHPVATERYMLEALACIMRTPGTGHFRFLFFSDEIDHCKQFVYDHFKNNVRFFFSKGDVESDFKKMMHCEHQIVSNSSFSVLSAILNPNRRRIVICPDESSYFGLGNSHLDTSTIMPEDWMRVKF